MKRPVYLNFFIGFIVFMAFSCQTDTPDEGLPVADMTEHDIKFELYTSQDFSDDNHDITFKAIIESSRGTIWDSILSPIKIKDLPSEANKISFTIKYALETNCDDCQYRAGFRYEINGLGTAWHFEEINTSEIENLVSYNFN